MFKTVSLASILLFILSGCAEESQQQAQKETPALPVEVIVVENKNIPIWMQYTGRTQASSSQEVRARVTGILEAVYFKDGEYVKKGQKLFKIEQTDYIAALDSAKAKKRRDLAALKLAKADVNRYRPLVKEGLAPRVTLEQYEAQVASLEADIFSDEASIRQAELELSYTIVTAPIDGQASRRLVDAGNLVGKNEATLLTTINKNDPLYAYFSPSEEDFQKINKFKDSDLLQAYITFDYQLKALGSISKLGFINFSDNTVDNSTSTISMRAEIPNEDNLIFPGTFVYVNVYVTNRLKFVGVPPDVIFEDQRGKFVYSVNDENKAKKIYVEPLFESRFFTLLQKDAIKDGERIIINALLRLKEDLLVKPTDVTDTKGIDAVIKENNLVPSLPEKKE